MCKNVYRLQYCKTTKLCVTARCVLKWSYSVMAGQCQPRSSFLQCFSMHKLSIQRAVLAIVDPLVCPSHAGTVSRRENLEPPDLHRPIAHSFQFLQAKVRPQSASRSPRFSHSRSAPLI